MTRIEKAVKIVSDLNDFYRKISKISAAPQRAQVRIVETREDANGLDSGSDPGFRSRLKGTVGMTPRCAPRRNDDAADADCQLQPGTDE